MFGLNTNDTNSAFTLILQQQTDGNGNLTDGNGKIRY
jgi:hypothetical protein